MDILGCEIHMLHEFMMQSCILCHKHQFKPNVLISKHHVNVADCRCSDLKTIFLAFWGKMSRTANTSN